MKIVAARFPFAPVFGAPVALGARSRDKHDSAMHSERRRAQRTRIVFNEKAVLRNAFNRRNLFVQITRGNTVVHAGYPEKSRLKTRCDSGGLRRLNQRPPQICKSRRLPDAIGIGRARECAPATNPVG